jgi:hypothetical protein
MEDRFASPKNLNLADIDWIGDELGKALNAGIADAVEAAVDNIARQVKIVTLCDGDLAILLKPVDMETEKEKFVTVQFDSENILVEFNFFEALEAEVEWWVEDGRPSPGETRIDEWPDRKAELLALAEKIKALADRLA